MPETSPLLGRLPQVLQEEEIQCDLLAETVQAERRALRHFALADFVGVNRRRLDVLQRLRELEEERGALVAQLAEHWQLPGASVSLHSIIERLGPSGAQALDAQHQRLADKIRVLRHEISVNAGLLNGIQAFLHQGLRALRSANEPEALYSASGKPDQTGGGATLYRQKG